MAYQPEELVEVYCTVDKVEAELLLTSLKQNDISSFIFDDVPYGIVGLSIPVRIMVSKNQSSDAKEHINRHIESKKVDHSAEAPICSCGSRQFRHPISIWIVVGLYCFGFLNGFASGAILGVIGLFWYRRVVCVRCGRPRVHGNQIIEQRADS